MPFCGEMLDAALSSWEFLRAAVEGGCGGKIISALGATTVEDRNPYADDTYRWLTRCIHDFERDPKAEIEHITLKVGRT